MVDRLMPMEHYRPTIGSKKAGYYRGYYCGRCGAGGLAMYGNKKHGSGICLTNPLMVARLNEANTEEAETKRQFVRSLQRGKGDNKSPRRYDDGSKIE